MTGLMGRCEHCGGDVEMHYHRTDGWLKGTCPVCVEWEELKAMGAPTRFEGVSLDSYVPVSPDQEAAKSAIVAYIADLKPNVKSGRGIILWGSVGAGKTHLGLCVCLEAKRLGAGVKFIGEDQIFDSLKERWGDPQDEQEFLRGLQRVRLLLIDDMGIRKPTDYVAERYESIINARYADQLATIITTNRTPDQLRDVYERQMDRMSDALVVKVVGPSGRKAA